MAAAGLRSGIPFRASIMVAALFMIFVIEYKYLRSHYTLTAHWRRSSSSSSSSSSSTCSSLLRPLSKLGRLM